ncbi:MAG: flagellar protein [Lachnospiraceae bacterium]|nr:flagellar protein [Lachnospiraceae bacterium]
MEVRNCKQCGRLFNYVGGLNRNLCPACIDALEDKFQEVRKYVDENPRCTIEDICMNNDVTSKQVEKWIREDRLFFSDDSPIGIACEKCGKTIKSGRFCKECADALGNQMDSLYRAVNDMPQAPKKSSSRMRFLDK